MKKCRVNGLSAYLETLAVGDELLDPLRCDKSGVLYKPSRQIAINRQTIQRSPRLNYMRFAQVFDEAYNAISIRRIK